MDGSRDGGGNSGMYVNATALTAGDEFTVEVNPSQRAMLNLKRELRGRPDTVIDLN